MRNCALSLLLLISLVNGTLKPPSFDKLIIQKKMNKTGMYPQKIEQFLKIFSNNSTGIRKQRDAASMFINALKNEKVKKATRKVFDEMKNAQNFAWMALNKTEEILVPLIGLPLSQVQNDLDNACREAKGNFSTCLPAVFRSIALQAAHHSGKNQTKLALNQLLDWEKKEEKSLKTMHNFFL